LEGGVVVVVVVVNVVVVSGLVNSFGVEDLAEGVLLVDSEGIDGFFGEALGERVDEKLDLGPCWICVGAEWAGMSVGGSRGSEDL
jgi:hypothetical protein